MQEEIACYGLPRLDVSALIRPMTDLGAFLDIPMTLQELPRLPGERLSPRQRKVCLLIWEGKTNREMAAELGLSETRIVWAARQVMRKTGTRNRVHLARRIEVARLRGL